MYDLRGSLYPVKATGGLANSPRDPTNEIILEGKFNMLYDYDHSDELAQHLMLASAIFQQLQRVCTTQEMRFTPKNKNAHAYIEAQTGIFSFMCLHSNLNVRVGKNIIEEDLTALSKGHLSRFFSDNYVLQAHFYWSDGKPIRKMFSDNVKTWDFTFSIAVSYAHMRASDSDCCDFLLVQEVNTSHHKVFNSFIRFFKEFDYSEIGKHPTRTTSVFPLNLSSPKAMKLLELIAQKKG